MENYIAIVNFLYLDKQKIRNISFFMPKIVVTCNNLPILTLFM
jgi:hypothetical protein